jgi:hypothetical protein
LVELLRKKLGRLFKNPFRRSSELFDIGLITARRVD